MVGGAAGIYVYVASANDAREAATADAGFAARKAASQLSANITFLDQTLQPVASGPAGEQLIANPAACTLGYAPVGAFGAGHVDLVLSDGTVACTSRTTGRGLKTYAGQSWLADLRSTIIAPSVDPATGDQVAVLAYPIGGKGFLAWFLELAPVGANLGDEFGSGVNQLEFLLTTSDVSSILTRSIDPKRWAGTPLAGTAFGSGAGSTDRTDVSGVQRWYAEATVNRGGWKVFVGASQSAALASVSRLQQRQSVIVGVGLLAVMLGMLYAYRRVAQPIAALSSSVRASRSRDSHTHVPVAGPREVAALGQDINELMDSFNSQWAEREKAERTYLQLFEGNPLPMVVSDLPGRFIDMNEAAVRAFGYSREEFWALSGSELYVPADEAERAQMQSLRDLTTTGGLSFMKFGPISFRRKDGSMMRAVGSTYIVEYLGKPARVSMIEDVTLTERLQRQIKQTERLEALGQLAGGIAHDFNNLLAVILNVTASLRASVLPNDPTGESIRDLDRIDKAAQSATRLTRQLLSFARREVFAGAPLDVGEQIRGLTELLRRTLGSHVVLTAVLPDHVWPVRMDPGQLEQIVINLSVNARDAMVKGGQLTIATDNVVADDAFVQAHPGLTAERYVRLQLSDTGVGMDRTTLDRLFEPFFTTKPVGHGTGLGLATVYGIVKQLHGDISVSSQVGRGTTFTVLLPATEADMPAPPVTETPAVPAPARVTAAILVVEDYADLRDLFSEILRGAGYTVVTAPDGAAGLEAAHAHAGEIDLLLTDIVMPNMLGSDLARQLRQENPRLRVIYMSGHAQPVLGGAVVLEPGTPLLQKPFMEAELLDKIQEVLSARPGGEVAAGALTAG